MTLARIGVVAALLALLMPAAAGTTVEDAHKQAVLEFYDLALNHKDFAAAAKYLGPRYIQHNPNAADGIEGFKEVIELRRAPFPKAESRIKRAFAEGDCVILHVQSIRTPGEGGAAIVDIFRLDNGKLVEPWDVVQPIPEQAANANTMI
jgi:predicted SnoaL-like aldol condensation-catalyzing enzyme